MGQQGLWLSSDVLAAGVNQLRPHMAIHLEVRRDELQHLSPPNGEASRRNRT
jgi:hypothetical protein